MKMSRRGRHPYQARVRFISNIIDEYNPRLPPGVRAPDVTQQISDNEMLQRYRVDVQNALANNQYEQNWYDIGQHHINLIYDDNWRDDSPLDDPKNQSLPPPPPVPEDPRNYP